MRGHPIRLLSGVLASLIAFCTIALGGRPAIGQATAPPPRPANTPALQIEPPGSLVVGATASIRVLVRLGEGQQQPLLLTPSAEGEAIRVVRGRLLRADAQPTAEGELRFEVPIVARRAGTAVLRVELLTYRCAATCSALRVSASHVVEVTAP